MCGNDLATSIARKMDNFARTAVTGAQNAGRIDRMHQAQEMGIRVRKKWLAAHDDRVRDSHAELDGTVVDVDEDFVTINGNHIAFPGDPSAPPEEVYNCRCTLVYVYPDFEGSVEAVEESEEAAHFAESDQQSRKNKDGDYSVDWAVIDSPEYRTAFEQIDATPRAQEAAYTRARWMLSNRDGSGTEELYAVSRTSGRKIARITNQNNDHGVTRTREFDNRIRAVRSSDLLFIHNHPGGTPPSMADINTLFSTPGAAGITVGHNGSLYYYTAPKRVISQQDWVLAELQYSMYNVYARAEKALEYLANQYGFEFIALRR